MIQINLLPNVKQEYLKSQQMKHTFIVGSVIMSLAAVGLLVLMFSYVQVVQPAQKNALQKSINTNIAQIKKQNDAAKIITVQGALEQLPGLQDKKLITSNVFKYLTSFTPRSVSYNDVALDLTSDTLTLSGATTNTEEANVLANNLKSAKFSYKKADQTQNVAPFKNIVFSSLSRNEKAQDGKNVSFQLSFTFDPVMFDQSISEQSLQVNAASEQLLIPDSQPFSNVASPAGGL